MLKIWSYAFWGRPPAASASPGWRTAAAPASLLVMATVVLGLWGQPLLRFASDAADELTQPAPYIEAVLGRRRMAAGDGNER
jgi:multicomponent Na+:H+ antiporter subunit D